MTTLPFPPSTSHPDSEEKPVYSLVIVYEDIATGKRANHFCDNLMQELGESALLAKDLWSFKVLDIPQVRRVAAEVAAAADVVILALDGHAELPDGVKAWLEEWVGRPAGRKPILIGLFSAGDDGQGTAASTRAFFSAAAETAGLTFLHTREHALAEDRSAA
jgi:hypothetical protein